MTDKIALITGASRGLGRSMALHLAARGVHIIGTYNSAKDKADAAAKEIEGHGVKAVILPFDAEADDLSPFVVSVREALASTFGTDRLDMLVNNAGIGAHYNVTETPVETLDLMLRVHVRTPFVLTQAMEPLINDGGSVLFVSSGLARFTLPGYAAYASAKGAIEVLTRYCAKEFGARKIRVNVVAPGAIATDFSGGTVRDNADVSAFVSSSTALGRVGQADDVGKAVASLLSDEMAWVNGQRIEVSGGQSI